MKKLGMMVAIAVLAGCSTLTTTTASFTYMHSPMTADLVTRAQSGLVVGGQLIYEVDRGQSRLGACGLVGRQETGPATGNNPKAMSLPANSYTGSFCHKSDIGHGVYARSLEERWMRQREAEASN